MAPSRKRSSSGNTSSSMAPSGDSSAPARKQKRGVKKAEAIAVQPLNKVLKALAQKAKLLPEEADALDYKAYNRKNLLLAKNVGHASFQKRQDHAVGARRVLVLEDGDCMCVEADGDRYDAVEMFGNAMNCGGLCPTLGLSTWLGTGCNARMATQVIHTVPGPGMCLRIKTVPDGISTIWPTGVINYAKSRTLEELLDDAMAWLTPSQDGMGVRVYVGIKEYEPTGQMVAFLAEKLTSGADGAIAVKEAVSFGTSPLGGSTLNVLHEHVGRDLVLKGVGFGDEACKRPGIPAYQIHLRSELLFDGEPPACFPASGIHIDLFYLLRSLEKNFSQVEEFSKGLGLCYGCSFCY